MFSIAIDIAPFQAIFDALTDIDKGNSGALSTLMRDMGDLVIAEWHQQATLALKNPSGYIQQIDTAPQYPDENPLHVRIENHHKAAVFLEFGTEPFDLKIMLETSSKVKVSKEGKKYIRIPFGHSKASLVSYGLGNQAAELTASRKQIPSVGDPRRTAWGDRLKAGGIGMRSKTFTVTGDLAKGGKNALNTTGAGTRKIQYTWKSSPFENLVRMEDKFGQTSGFSTFRTISEKSDSDSWIHSGIKASHIAERTTEIVRPVLIQGLGEALQKAFNSIGQK
jgi:hypothetical protein